MNKHINFTLHNRNMYKARTELSFHQTKCSRYFFFPLTRALRLHGYFWVSVKFSEWNSYEKFNIQMVPSCDDSGQWRWNKRNEKKNERETRFQLSSQKSSPQTCHHTQFFTIYGLLYAKNDVQMPIQCSEIVVKTHAVTNLSLVQANLFTEELTHKSNN